VSVPPERPSRGGLVWQSAAGALLLVAVLATLAGVDGLSRSEALREWTDRIQYGLFASGQQIFLNRGSFLEFEDRLILEELPSAEHARGGVFFLGSSNLKWGLALWELSEAQRAGVHNYGIGASNHASLFHFTKFLFEQQGLDRAPPDRTLFVLGLSAQGAFMERSRYFEALWSRYGLYRYDPERGISVVERSRCGELFAAEKARLVSFIGGVLNQIGRVLAARFGLPLAPGAGAQSPRSLERMAAAFEVEKPRGRMERQLGQLERLLDYLEERGVAVALVQLPERSLVREKSLPRSHREALREIAGQRRLRFADLSALLRDDEFLDLNHANVAGLPKVHAALLGVAEAHFRAAGRAGLPGSGADGEPAR
jgi:hypothetical protein